LNSSRRAVWAPRGSVTDLRSLRINSGYLSSVPEGRRVLAGAAATGRVGGVCQAPEGRQT